MNCEKYQEMISAFIDGELSVEEELNLHDHLAGCDSCRQLAYDIRQLRDVISAEDQTKMPAPIEKKILTRITADRRKKVGLFNFIGGYYRVPRGAAWATLVLLVALAINTIVNPFSPPRQAEISYDFLSSDIKIQKIELTEADVVGVRTFTEDGNGS